MLTIVHDGISETRHCAPVGDKWQGFVLDADRRTFSYYEYQSGDLTHRLSKLHVTMKPYQANVLYKYTIGDDDGYAAHVKHEHMRAQVFLQQQRTALNEAEFKAELKRKAKEAA